MDREMRERSRKVFDKIELYRQRPDHDPMSVRFTIENLRVVSPVMAVVHGE